MVALEDAVSPVTRRPVPTGRVSSAVTEAVPLVTLLALFFVVHDVKGMLTAPYWIDEAWVALSTRFPVHDLPLTTSSTPIGWSALLRLVPDVDDLRVVPLGFHLLCVAAAYLFGRALTEERSKGILTGTVSALAVLLLPAQQIRHDLKQYTADAALAVGLLALTAWTERTWSRPRLAVIVATVAVGMLVSHTTALVAPLVFGGLLLSVALRRQWRRLVEVAVAGLVAGGFVAAVYFGISARGNSERMRDYWAAYFPGLTELPGYFAKRMPDLLPLIGIPAPILIGLLLLGVLTLFRRGYSGSAAAVLLLPVAATGLGVAGIYPLLDQRTSHFLLVVAAVTAGVGLAGLADLVATLAHRGLPRLRPVVVAAAICAVLAGGFATVNHRWFRYDGDEPGLYRYRTPMATTDTRTATRYIAAHAGPDDIVVVSPGGWYGFAFYSDRDPLELVRNGTTIGFTVQMPTRSNVVLVSGIDEMSIRSSIDRALTQAATRPGARVWLIRHYIRRDAQAYQAVLADYRVELVTTGVEPVALISRR